MIDLATGEVEFFGIKIKPGSKLSDYYDCDPEVIHVHDRGNGRGRVEFKSPIISNNIRATVKATFETDEGVVRIEIYPKFDTLPEVDSTLWPGLRVERSKKWLRGMTKNGEYQECSGSICGVYSWGNIYSNVFPDRDYGTTGGWIEIEYER